VSVFYVLDLNGRPLRDFEAAFGLLPPTALALFDPDDVQWGEPTRCETFRNCGPPCFAQFHKFQTCLRLVEAAEAVRGRRFDWVLRLRPDTSFEAPVGDLEGTDATVVHTTMTVNGDPDDNFAVMARRLAPAYFDVGKVCPHPGAAWRTSCAIDWRGSHIYPECAIRNRLTDEGVRFRAFPKIYRIHRESVCRPGDPRGCGECQVGVCRDNQRGGHWSEIFGEEA